MKKINIITFHRAHNYGAVLQAFALQNKLMSKNYDVEEIDYTRKNLLNSYKIFKPIRKNIPKWIKENLNSLKNYKYKKMRYLTFNNFINKYIKTTSIKYNEKSIIKNPPVSDIYITGSDQVWNIGIVTELSDIYTLNFGNKNVRRISYAASVGDASQILKNKDLYNKKISKIDYISVREQDAKYALDKIINKDIEVVLDPTLLLKKDEWDEHIKYLNTESQKYILAYVVQPDEEYVKIVNFISEKTGLKVIHFELKNPGYKNVLKSAYTEGPLEFVNYIKNAEYVVATSFHATVFSIIFNKKFFIVPHRKTGARVTNLLDKLGIEGRTFSSYNEFKDIDYNFETNWKDVNKKLDIEREKSINWLLNAINDEKEEKNE